MEKQFVKFEQIIMSEQEFLALLGYDAEKYELTHIWHSTTNENIEIKITQKK